MEKKTETNRFGKNHVTVWNIKQNNKGENMIAYIKGELVETLPGSVILDVRGIGYRIYISGRESEQLTKMGSQVKLHTYFHVKEDAMQLYGFQHKDDLEVFSLLLGVSGIGPKAALGILTAFSADDLRFAVLSEDAKTIAKAPGIGVKTAKKMILELKDKLGSIEPEEVTTSESVTGNVSFSREIQTEAVQALVTLGYGSTEALRAVTNVMTEQEESVEEILKKALKFLI